MSGNNPGTSTDTEKFTILQSVRVGNTVNSVAHFHRVSEVVEWLDHLTAFKQIGGVEDTFGRFLVLEVGKYIATRCEMFADAR